MELVVTTIGSSMFISFEPLAGMFERAEISSFHKEKASVLSATTLKRSVHIVDLTVDSKCELPLREFVVDLYRNSEDEAPSFSLLYAFPLNVSKERALVKFPARIEYDIRHFIFNWDAQYGAITFTEGFAQEEQYIRTYDVSTMPTLQISKDSGGRFMLDVKVGDSPLYMFSFDRGSGALWINTELTLNSEGKPLHA